jgi:hypothetical protein
LNKLHNVRQVKAVLFAKDKGEINNSDYQTLNDVSKATATRDLAELVEKFNIMLWSREVGAGTSYFLIGSIGSIGSLEKNMREVNKQSRKTEATTGTRYKNSLLFFLEQ